MRIVGGRVLSQKLNMLLCVRSRLVHQLTSFAGSLGKLLGLVLDLGVEAVEDGEDGAL
jgi:hypothetical protein